MIYLPFDLEKDIKSFIKKNEGLRLKPYKDSSGILTIGYGHNLEYGISKKIAEAIFDEDFDNTLGILNDVLEEHDIRFEDLPYTVKIALMDMTFNLGYKVREFKKMLEAIKVKDWMKASNEALASLWAKQVKNRAIIDANLIRSAVNRVHSFKEKEE